MDRVRGDRLTTEATPPAFKRCRSCFHEACECGCFVCAMSAFLQAAAAQAARLERGAGLGREKGSGTLEVAV